MVFTLFAEILFSGKVADVVHIFCKFRYLLMLAELLFMLTLARVSALCAVPKHEYESLLCMLST